MKGEDARPGRRKRLPGLPANDPGDAERLADEEIRFHLDRTAAELEARGWDPEAARIEARSRFGDPGAARSDLKRMTLDRARSDRRRGYLAELRQDAAFAGRLLARRRTLAAAAVLTLGLGIGAATAVWSVVDLLLVRPLPYEEPERLVALLWPDRTASAEELEYLRQRTRSYAALGGASSGWTMAWTDTPDPTQLSGTAVTTDFLDLLGVPPARGRGFLPAEGAPGAAPVVVLPHAFWRDHLGGDPAVLGRVLTLNGQAHEVVGVMPRGFEDFLETDFWFPFVVDPGSWTYTGGVLQLVGRLEGGVAVDVANREFRGVLESRRQEASLPDDYADRVRVVSLREHVVGDARTLVLVVFGGVLLALLVAAANVANLYLAQALDRRRELALRAALGAGRARIARQLTSEALLLGLAGGALGLSLGYTGTGLLRGLLPPDTPRLGELGMDPRVLPGAVALAVVTSLLVALSAAAWATRRGGSHALRAGPGAGSARSRGRGVLVVTQVGLATVLLTGASLMVRTVTRLAAVDPGFRVERLLTARIQVPSTADESGAAFLSRYRLLQERVGALPGVESVAAVHHLPMSGAGWVSALEVEGRLRSPTAPEYSAGWRIATQGYFRTMSIPLIEGRDFQPGDSAGAEPVLVLSRRAARDLFGAESPVGRRVRAGNATRGEFARVVGVVGDVRHGSLHQEAPPTFYRPHTQHPMTAMMLAVRTAGRPEHAAGSVRAALRSVEPNMAITAVRPMRDLARGTIATHRSVVVLLSAFAVVGVLLAVVGIYGIVAYGVRARQRELGIRFALGARTRRVEAGLVLEGVKRAALGAAGGVAVALPLSRTLRGLVYGVSPSDPLAPAAAALLLIAAAALASWLPARRAGRIDPVRALREE